MAEWYDTRTFSADATPPDPVEDPVAAPSEYVRSAEEAHAPARESSRRAGPPRFVQRYPYEDPQC